MAMAYGGSGVSIAEAFAQGIKDEAPKTDRKLAEYRKSAAFKALPLHEQKMVGLLHLYVRQITEMSK